MEENIFYGSLNYKFIAKMETRVSSKSFDEIRTEEMREFYKNMFSLTGSGNGDTSFWLADIEKVGHFFCNDLAKGRFASLKSSQHKILTRSVA